MMPISPSNSSSSLSSNSIQQPLERIKEILEYPSCQDSEISLICRSILKRPDKGAVLLDVVKLLWNSSSTNAQPVITTLINYSFQLDDRTSLNIFNQFKTLLGTQKISQDSIINMMPILVSNIRRKTDSFTGYIDLSDTRILNDNLVPLVRIMREINTMKETEKNSLIKRLIEILSRVDLEICPNVVRELLMLCNKANSQYCLASVVSLFNDHALSSSQLSQSSISEDSRRIIEIQSAVIRYCYDIAEIDNEFVREILKFCKDKNSVYSISGFMCSILLKLSGHEYVKDQILAHLKSCINDCFIDNKLYLESAFVRVFCGDFFDMESLLMKAIKFCCVTEKEHIADSLVDLGFLLIKSGLPRSKVVNLK